MAAIGGADIGSYVSSFGEPSSDTRLPSCFVLLEDSRITVGVLLARLQGLDSDLPIGVIDVIRVEGSRVAEVRLHELTDIDTIHDPVSGVPRAVWLTSHTPSGETSDELREAAPSFALLANHRCDCLLPVSFARPHPRRNLDAVPCSHHIPSEVTLQSNARERRRLGPGAGFVIPVNSVLRCEGNARRNPQFRRGR